jgi:hypothetical protein
MVLLERSSQISTQTISISKHEHKQIHLFQLTKKTTVIFTLNIAFYINTYGKIVIRIDNISQ